MVVVRVKMWWVVGLVLGGCYATLGYHYNGDVEVLTENLFDNLKGFSQLSIVNGDLSDESKDFIDRQIANYVSVITREGLGASKKKRSLLDVAAQSPQDIYLLSGITRASTIPVNFPADITLFQLKSRWFIAALESLTSRHPASTLLIFEYKQDETVEEIMRRTINKGVRISTISLPEYTLLAVAENDTLKENFDEKSGIYKFDGDELIKIQSIDMNYANDVVMWRINNEIYMSIAQFTSNEMEIPIYRWLGQHFDLMQTVPASGVKKLVPFDVNLGHFLALANFKDNKGNTRVYSDIYKYDYHTGTYALHQKILTEGCTDIAVFNLPPDGFMQDHFLIVANSQHFDFDGNINYNTDSIIYKYIDDYFIPFQTLETNGVLEWLPVEGKNEFVLFEASRFEGLKAYQYDGWSFREVPQKNRPMATSVRGVRYQDTSILVVSDKNNEGSLLRLNFTKHNTLAKVYEDMMTWCHESLTKIDKLSTGQADSLLGRSERADIIETDEDLEEMSAKIESVNLILDELEVNETVITADKIIVNNTAFIPNLYANTINNFNADDFLGNVLNIEEGFEVGEIIFDSLTSADIKAKSINGQDPGRLLHRNDDLNFDVLKVNGIIAKKGVQIGGTLNGVVVDNKNILLTVGEQNFTRPLTVDVAQIDKMTARVINGATMDGKPIIIDHITNLTLKDLTIGGYINDVDVPTLDKLAVKITEDQEITGEYIFDELVVEDLVIEGTINGKKTQDLIPIDGGNYSISPHLLFENNIYVENLQVGNSLNGDIGVINGTLDVLFNGRKQEQQITGQKIFEDVVVDNPIFLQGRIESEILNRMNPVIAIDRDLVLEGDQIISGKVQIENFLDAADVVTPDNVYSLGRLQDEGLELGARVITPHLQFVQQVNVGEIFVDTINGQDPAGFVVLGTDETQIIDALKTFPGDLYIDGASSVQKINEVDVDDLKNNIMKPEENQTIIGKHHIKDATVHRIICDKIKIGNYVVGEDANQIDNFTLIIDNDLEVEEITASDINVQGFVNGLNFDQIISDTVTTNHNQLIGGAKTFDTLSINNLTIESGPEINTESINQLSLEGPVEIQQLAIHNIYFTNQFNGIDRDNFGRIELDENGARPVIDEQDFDTIVVYGRAFIASNKINNVELRDLVEDTVKIDEPFEFNSATFETVVCKKPLILNGHIENLDFDNIVWADLDLDQVVWDDKIFKNVTVMGDVNFEGLVNGLNMSQFCDFAMGGIETKNLTIDGSGFFVHGPNVANLNNVNVSRIRDRGWFADEDTFLTGNVEFDGVIFEKDVSIKGFVDNVRLSYLAENYLSKTKDQNINAVINFKKGVIFNQGGTIPAVTLIGEINGLNLDEFVHTALLDDYEQVFETMLYLENCTITNLSGEFLVNDYNLDKDVMRFDKTNMVTGRKIFNNLNINALSLDKNIKIQGVDVLNWFRTSVLATTDYNITGNKSFRNAVFYGNLQIDGGLNGLKIDENNVVLRDTPQEISGFKTFTQTVGFKSVKLKGKLNGVDVFELVNNQALKNEPNNIRSGINFENNITTNNLVVNGLYQGINITDLITNVTNLGALNNLVDEYKNLEFISRKLQKSIENQAYFLHHYKLVQTIPNMKNSMKMKAFDGSNKIGALVSDDNQARMVLYGWHPKEEKFVEDASIKFANEPRYVAQVFNDRYLYVEEKEGLFMRMSNTMETIATIPTNHSKSSTSFTLPSSGDSCTVFVYYDCNPKIYCKINESVSLMQVLTSPNAFKAQSINIKDVVHLVIINEPLEGVESQIDLWVYNPDRAKFDLHQSFFGVHPKSLSTVSFNGFHYLVVALGHLTNAMYSGRVEIRRFDDSLRVFLPWQTLELDAPIQVELSILPSNELVLYILTDNPTEPLLVYRYEGIAGFKLKVTGSVLPKMQYMNLFVGEANQHFIVAQGYEEINLIEAIFKGVK